MSPIDHRIRHRMIHRSIHRMAAIVVGVGLATTACSASTPAAAPQFDPPVTTSPDTSTEPSDTTDRPTMPATGSGSSSDADREPASDPGSDRAASPVGDLEEPADLVVDSPSEQLASSGYLDDGATEADIELAAQDTCSSLAVTIVETNQSLLDELGDAGRDDIDAVDAAFEDAGRNGVLVDRRADELGCNDDEVTQIVCQSASELRASGDVGDDLVAILTSGCA